MVFTFRGRSKNMCLPFRAPMRVCVCVRVCSQGCLYLRIPWHYLEQQQPTTLSEIEKCCSHLDNNWKTILSTTSCVCVCVCVCVMKEVGPTNLYVKFHSIAISCAKYGTCGRRRLDVQECNNDKCEKLQNAACSVVILVQSKNKRMMAKVP